MLTVRLSLYDVNELGTATSLSPSILANKSSSLSGRSSVLAWRKIERWGAVYAIRTAKTAFHNLCRKRFCVIRTRVAYRVFMAMALMIFWLVANSPVASVASADNTPSRSFGLMATSLDMPDVYQNERLSVAAVYSVGFGTIKSLKPSSVERAEAPARLREDANSYQRNCTFLL